MVYYFVYYVFEKETRDAIFTVLLGSSNSWVQLTSVLSGGVLFPQDMIGVCGDWSASSTKEAAEGASMWKIPPRTTLQVTTNSSILFRSWVEVKP